MRRAALAAALAAILVAALPAAGAPRFPNPYPCGACLFTVRADGKDFHAFSLEMGDLMDLSPDRGRVLFHDTYAGDYSVYVARTDGSGRRALVANGAGARFSPDGSKVAFHTPVGGTASPLGYGVWVIGADGRGLTKVSNGGTEEIAWAPDSRRLAYREVDGTLTIAEVGRPRGSFVHVDGGSPFAWSPRGDLLASTAFAEPSPPDAIGGSGGGRAERTHLELRVVRSNGSLVRTYRDVSSATWAPDGRRLALEHDDRPFVDVPPAPSHETASLRVARIPGSAGRPRSAHAGTWSPDGRWIAFADPGLATGVWVVGSQRGAARRVVELEPEGEVDEVWWSRDGKRLFFSWSWTEFD